MLFNFAFTIVQQTVNRVLRLDPLSAERLQSLNGKLMKIQVQGTGLDVFVDCNGEQIMIGTEAQREVDTEISATPMTLLRITLSEQTPDDVKINGSTDVAQSYQDLFRQLDIDWEEMLSGAVGDVLAHQMGNVARDIKFGLDRGIDTVKNAFKEVIHEKAEGTPYKFELDTHSQEVAQVRAATDRLEKRVQRLEKRIKEQGVD